MGTWITFFVIVTFLFAVLEHGILYNFLKEMKNANSHTGRLLLSVLGFVLLMIWSVNVTDNELGYYSIGALPALVPLLMAAFLWLVQQGFLLVDKATDVFWTLLTHAMPRIVQMRNESTSIIKSLRKRVGNLPEWSGVISDVLLLAQRIPQIQKEIRRVIERIAEVKTTIKKVGVEGDGKTNEGREIKSILHKLEAKKERLEALELRMRQTIGLAHARSALSDDGESADRLQEEVAGLMQSADYEMGLATKTGNELDPKKQHGARQATQRTA
jgi:hypothetical protein